MQSEKAEETETQTESDRETQRQQRPVFLSDSVTLPPTRPHSPPSTTNSRALRVQMPRLVPQKQRQCHKETLPNARQREKERRLPSKAHSFTIIITDRTGGVVNLRKGLAMPLLDDHHVRSALRCAHVEQTCAHAIMSHQLSK